MIRSIWSIFIYKLCIASLRGFFVVYEDELSLNQIFYRKYCLNGLVEAEAAADFRDFQAICMNILSFNVCIAFHPADTMMEITNAVPAKRESGNHGNTLSTISPHNEWMI